jgi:hypothetical protein
MVQKLRVVFLVLTLLIAPCFVNSIEILIPNDIIEATQDYTLNFQTDVNAFCYFISGNNDLYELIVNDANFVEEQPDVYFEDEFSEIAQTSHQILIALETCKQSTQNNCFGDLICFDEAYLEISEELIYDQEIIDQYFVLKPISFIEVVIEEIPLDSPTPVVSPSPESNILLETKEVCVPDCTNKICGEDGCGGICGYCSENEQCYAGQCINYGSNNTEPKQNIIGANFNNNSSINWSDELVFQTNELSMCFFYYDDEPISLESTDGRLHSFPKNYLTTGDNNLIISCITLEDSLEETKTYSFKIDNSTNDNSKKTNLSVIILIVLIIATVFTISTILLVIFLISPKKNSEKEQLITPINFQNNTPVSIQPNVEKLIINKKIRSFPKKHLDYVFDQFQSSSNNSFDKIKTEKTTNPFDKEQELERYENSLYIDLSNELNKNKATKKNTIQTEKSHSQDESAKIKIDPTKELASIMLNEQLSNNDPLTPEDIIDMIRYIGLKNSNDISSLFFKLLNQKKVKKEQLLLIVQDMRKLNVIDEMQALEILSKSNLLN